MIWREVVIAEWVAAGLALRQLAPEPSSESIPKGVESVSKVGGEVHCAWTKTGAVPPWKAVGGRSTCGRTWTSKIINNVNNKDLRFSRLMVHRLTEYEN